MLYVPSCARALISGQSTKLQGISGSLTKPFPRVMAQLLNCLVKSSAHVMSIKCNMQDFSSSVFTLERSLHRGHNLSASEITRVFPKTTQAIQHSNKRSPATHNFHQWWPGLVNLEPCNAGGVSSGNRHTQASAADLAATLVYCLLRCS